MNSDVYQQILTQASSALTADEQRRLSEELAAIASRSISPKRSITELRGLGKEVWQNVDAVQHVAVERDSWDG